MYIENVIIITDDVKRLKDDRAKKVADFLELQSAKIRSSQSMNEYTFKEIVKRCEELIRYTTQYDTSLEILEQIENA